MAFLGLSGLNKKAGGGGNGKKTHYPYFLVDYVKLWVYGLGTGNELKEYENDCNG